MGTVTVGYKMSLRLALAVRETVAGHWLGALERGGGVPPTRRNVTQGVPPPLPMHPCPPPPAPVAIERHNKAKRGNKAFREGKMCCSCSFA